LSNITECYMEVRTIGICGKMKQVSKKEIIGCMSEYARSFARSLDKGIGVKSVRVCGLVWVRK